MEIFISGHKKNTINSSNFRCILMKKLIKFPGFFCPNFSIFNQSKVNFSEKNGRQKIFFDSKQLIFLLTIVLYRRNFDANQRNQMTKELKKNLKLIFFWIEDSSFQFYQNILFPLSFVILILDWSEFLFLSKNYSIEFFLNRRLIFWSTF